LPKLSLNDLTNLQNEQTAVAQINANNTAIETAMENTLSRNGATPNTMGSNLDMNSNRILNLAAAVSPSEPIRKAEFDAATGDLSELTGLVSAADASADAAALSAAAAAASAQAAQDALDDVLEGSVADNAITNAKMADNAVGTDELINLAVTNAKMANMSQARVKGRAVTAGTGTPSDLTITEVMDMQGSTRGMIPVRGASTWAGLAAGTAGQVLTMGASDPAWATAVSVPAGSIVMYAANAAPSGWLECNGASIDRTTYAALFTAIGTTFGSVSGSVFNVPDLRGHFVRGWDNSRGVDSGRAFGSSQANQVGPHAHTATTTTSGSFSGTAASDGDHTHTVPLTFLGTNVGGTNTILSSGGSNDQTPISTSSSGAHTHTVSGSITASSSTTVNSNGGTESRPINTALMYIIKT
jgi:microcystin-dependent protein